MSYILRVALLTYLTLPDILRLRQVSQLIKSIISDKLTSLINVGVPNILIVENEVAVNRIRVKFHNIIKLFPNINRVREVLIELSEEDIFTGIYILRHPMPECHYYINSDNHCLQMQLLDKLILNNGDRTCLSITGKTVEDIYMSHLMNSVVTISTWISWDRCCVTVPCSLLQLLSELRCSSLIKTLTIYGGSTEYIAKNNNNVFSNLKTITILDESSMLSFRRWIGQRVNTNKFCILLPELDEIVLGWSIRKRFLKAFIDKMLEVGYQGNISHDRLQEDDPIRKRYHIKCPFSPSYPILDPSTGFRSSVGWYW